MTDWPQPQRLSPSGLAARPHPALRATFPMKGKESGWSLPRKLMELDPVRDQAIGLYTTAVTDNFTPIALSRVATVANDGLPVSPNAL